MVIINYIIIAKVYSIFADNGNLHCISDLSSGFINFPNISDVYFNQSKIVNFSNLSVTNQDRFHILPPQYEYGRNCSGSVLSIKFCYKLTYNQWMSIYNQDIPIFNIVLGRTQVNSSFIVSRNISVISRPTTNICTQKTGNGWWCCDHFNSNGQSLFQILSSKFVYGIFPHFSLITFRKSLNVSWYPVSTFNEHTGSYSLHARRTAPLVLLQFLTGIYHNLFS